MLVYNLLTVNNKDSFHFIWLPMQGKVTTVHDMLCIHSFDLLYQFMPKLLVLHRK